MGRGGQATKSPGRFTIGLQILNLPHIAASRNQGPRTHVTAPLKTGVIHKPGEPP
jgi:hypothetical protein